MRGARWLLLYGRSRQLPASLAVLLLGAPAVWALVLLGGGSADPRPATLVLAAGATVFSVGLGGQDRALDRSAAIRWLPRRAAHVLLCGALVGAVLLAVTVLSGERPATGLVVRNSAGLTGLVALGAACWGARSAWLLPFGWLGLSLVVPPSGEVVTRVLTWMLLPPGSAAGTWTAVVLAVAGTAAYAVAGPRR
ncbi:hypothetical protein ACFYVL_04840 [Streptomyces sp. NPDC004111]|uniref:hypothetical protein n=1 Tax=Streptomyces sp. NPDC004111 TaxID=3364690 RepID=UPI0036A962A6